MFGILKKSCNFANELSNQLKTNDYDTDKHTDTDKRNECN